MFMKNLLPSSKIIYKSGGKVTTTLTSSVNNTDGATFEGPTMTLNVADASQFPDKPIVVIDPGTTKAEAFMCSGKTSNTITGCIRGQRYDKGNVMYSGGVMVVPSHNNGATVEQGFEYMFREVDTGNWINYPQNYGLLVNGDTIYVADSNEYGRWTIRVENTSNENNTNFLNVLHPTINMSETQMAETVLIDAGNMAGALIKDSSNQRVVIFSKTGDLQGGLGYQANYTGNAKHLITGMEDGVYDIYKNGTKIYTIQTSIQNTLYFESNGGLNFR